MRAYILQIDTATSVCTVAISKDGQTVQAESLHEDNVHASKLTLLIDAQLAALGITYQQLAAVAVSMGPGSYTGLRIGVSTAKGLCYALDIPLIGINTLKGMAMGLLSSYQGDTFKQLFLPMIDARRMEVYTAYYDASSKLIQDTAALIVDEHTFEDWTSKGYHLTLFGSGADKFSLLFQDNPRIKVLHEFVTNASYLSALAYEAFQNEHFEDVAYFEPYYLKDFVVTTAKKKVGL